MLQVWLPLNGNIKNQGLNQNITVTNSGATVNSSGKLGQCYNFTSSYLTLNNFNMSSKPQMSFCFWCCPTTASLAYVFTTKQNTLVQFTLNGANSFSFRDTKHSSLTSVSFTAPTANVWTHYAFVYDKGSWIIYKDGIKDGTGFVASSAATLNTNYNNCWIGYYNPTAGNQYYKGKLNDFRLYNHALSEKEVQEIAKGLVVHYKLDNNGLGGENLFIGSSYTSSDITNFVGNSDTDWTKPLRYYNGSKNIHSFADGIDTITLTSTSNLGIAFVRSAADINLDTNSQYTISCEAQCSSISKPLCIGLSYYTTANTWTWRGGTNGQNFKAIDTWQKFTLTFTPDANTQYICYCFTVATGGNNILKIRNCKLEKGSIATSWSPAPEEVGTNNTIYDCSGYQNNATPIGILTASTDTAKYSVATKFINTSYIRSLGRPNDFLPHDAITVNLWMKCTTWGNPISCTEGGGFNFEDISGIRFPVYISGVGYKLAESGISSSTLLNNWHMLTGTFDKATIKIYIDGELKATTTTSSTNDIGYANNYLFIGAEAAGNSTNPETSNFVGNISDVRIYATALSAAAIKDLYETSAEIDKNGNFYAREIIEL